VIARKRPQLKQQKSYNPKPKEKHVSIFSGIQNIEHTFASWAEKELAKLYTAAPKIEQVAGTVLTYAGPALQTIVSLEAGAPAGAIVGEVIQEAQSDLTAASGLIYDFGATPSAGSVIASVKTNLAALLAAGHVSNPTSVAGVNQVIGELDTLIAAIGKMSAPAPTPISAPVATPDPIPAPAPAAASTSTPDPAPASAAAA